MDPAPSSSGKIRRISYAKRLRNRNSGLSSTCRWHSNARSLCLSPGGTLFVGTRSEGSVYALRDTDGDMVADHALQTWCGGQRLKYKSPLQLHRYSAR